VSKQCQNCRNKDTSLKEPPPSGRSRDRAAESGSSAELLPQVYDELRRLARARIAREPAGLTLATECPDDRQVSEECAQEGAKAT
jgi:hypothetical protein